MKKLALLTIRLLAGLALSTLVARHIGSSGRGLTSAALIRRDVQIVSEVWCWREICPGRTTVANAREAILAWGGKLIVDEPDQLRANLPPGYTVILGNYERKPEPIDSTEIGPSATQLPLYLGDVMVNFGRPLLVDKETSGSFICFEAYLCIQLTASPSRLDPHLEVTSISLLTSRSALHENERGSQVWKGFTRPPAWWIR